MKKVAIMQPYFLPYIGYWQLMHSVGEFVIYDNIEYTKKGWFNRNRILEVDHDRLFTIPIKKDSDYLNVNQRFVSAEGRADISRTLRIIQNNYRKAPQFEPVYALAQDCFNFSEDNLFEYIAHSVRQVAAYVGIDTKLIVSSTIDIDHSLKAEQKVLAICEALQATTYHNSIGGRELYDKQMFQSHGIDLRFVESREVPYQQFGHPFVPWLSILDVLMFNDVSTVRQMLDEYDLV